MMVKKLSMVGNSLGLIIERTMSVAEGRIEKASVAAERQRIAETKPTL